MKKILPLLIVLILAFTANADVLNAKAVDSVTVKITYGGVLDVTGTVQKANLTYFIPQEGITSLDVIADGDMTWEEIVDSFGNKLILMEWNRPTGSIKYNIETTVHNNAKKSASDNAVGTDNRYLIQTQYVKIDDTIRQFAYPYEKSLQRASELTKFVYDYLDYDLNYVGKNVPSDQVAVQKRGVCVEHANLLTALLRANEIPTRYVAGYAYSTVQEKFIGHVWVEVLDATGNWVPFDPTWLQAGHLDATHIKSAALLDNGQIDTLTYIGGNIRWTRNEEKFSLLSHTESNITSIEATGTPEVNTDNFGYIKARIDTDECTIVTISAGSCVTQSGNRPLSIYQTNRTLWLCAPKDVYWFFKATGKNYACPVVLYDQTGSFTDYRVTVQEGEEPDQVSITGPSIVAVNEEFTLTASDMGVFYSPEFGVNMDNLWALSINKPGTYMFYLYANNGLYVKDVHVLDKKNFDVNVATVNETAFGTSFDINLTIKNLVDAQNVDIKVQFTNQTANTKQFFQKGEEKKIFFRMEANKDGWNDLVVSAAGNSLASETIPVYTPERKLALIDSIIKFFSDLFSLFRN